MPANPPYSIIDTIARLRASGGEAWGNAAAGVGKSIGSGIEKLGEQTAKARQDFFLNAQKTGVIRHAPPTLPATPGPGATPGGGVPPGAPGAAPAAPTILGGPQGRPAGQPGAPVATAGGPLPPQEGELTLADLARQSGSDKYFDKAHMAVLEHTAWKPNAVEKSEVQENLQQMNATLKQALQDKGIAGKMSETHHLVTPEEAKQYPGLKAMEGGWTTNKAYEEIVKPQGLPGFRGGGKGTAAEEAQWTSLFRLTNPTDAMRGSPLGTAAIANQRANRALEILDDKKMTPQRKSLAITDLAGIIQGGTPHEREIGEQNYGALQDRWAKLKTQLTAKPEMINQPEITAEIRDLVRGVKSVDNMLIKENLDQAETFFADRIKVHGADKWKKYRGQIEKSLEYGMKDEAPKAKGDPAARFKELLKAGKSEDEAYKTLAAEGH